MKKLVLVLVIVFALAIPALANPFIDVPLTHWAYDAVQTLAARGIVIGYPDGTFGGQRTLTRYEFAEATARMLAYVEQYGALAEDVELLSKLSIEFADELANLGIKVADLERALGEQSEAIAALQRTVDRHERFFEPVKISGTWKADYSRNLFSMTGQPLGDATLTDRVDLKFDAEINPETTASISLRLDNSLTGAPVVTFRKYDLKYMGDWSLWVSSDIKPATIGLGLVYDFGVNEEFPGAWAQWNWNTDEDLGTWTMFMEVEEFYLLNVAFNVGDDDDVPIGITASYDPAAGDVIVAGADIAFGFSDDKATFALEGAVLSDLTDIYFGAAAQLKGTFGDDEDLDLTVTGWYTQPGFAPTNSDYSDNQIGVRASLGIPLSDDPDDTNIKITPSVDYRINATTMDLERSRLRLRFDFTNIDPDRPEEKAWVYGEYRMESGDINFRGRYDNLALGSDDEFLISAYGDYIFRAVPAYWALANLKYNFPDDPMQLIVEGRLHSGSNPIYSAEAQLKYDVAENTVLKVGVEMNDWEADIADWSDTDDFVINDDFTKIYAGIEVKF